MKHTLRRTLPLVWLTMFSGTALADEVQCRFLSKLMPYQQDVAEIAYRAGQPYDLGLTSVAIAWKESKLGLYKVRMNTKYNDQSFGVMHTVAKWKTKGMSAFARGRWVQDMITSDIKSIDVGVQDILYWQQRAKGDWKKGIAMYNAGGNFNYGVSYARDVVDTVSRLKPCNF